MTIDLTNTTPKPFLKWAGGKAQLLPQILNLIQSRSSQWSSFTYIEPFVGAGAILFAVLAHCPRVNRVVINDINPILITAYKMIKDHPQELIDLLQYLQNNYRSLASLAAQKEFFLAKRDKFNHLDSQNPLLKTALFLFLNKTCYNGLYRVNSQGLFNVPFGQYKNPMICSQDNLLIVHHYLQKVEILQGDFSHTINWAAEKTLFYFDPPYKPIKATAAFNSYTQERFADTEQIRLKAFCDRLQDLGHSFIVSNSDVKNFDPDDNFFDDLYKDYTIQRVKARRNINSKGNSRGEISELIINNFN
jgi:DNA adenine methylase